jgi:cobaltochelatase CobS
MEQNDIIKQVIETIRKDILSDKKFIADILDNYQLEEKNIPPETILNMMNQLNQTIKKRLPVSNRPKDLKGTKAAKPSVSEDKNITNIVSDLLEGNNVYLMGKAGTGKTFLAEHVAQDVMGQPVFIINCSQWTSPIEIRGGQTITGYEEGLLIKAWAEGGILVLDELPKLDPNTAGLLNAALAKTADQPKYDDDGKIIPNSIPFIVNGKGEKIYKGQDAKNDDIRYRFGVIGTGNTDMMNVGNKYGGNQRQDYSLVDRFAGSYYKIENNPTLEKSLTYPFVWNICNALRDFLETNKLLQSISLRTMLNFNRTYEQQMLNFFQSVYADEIFDANGEMAVPKTINQSLESFESMMEESAVEKLRDYQPYQDATNPEALKNAKDVFVKQFMMKYHLNPRNGDVLTTEQIKDMYPNG